jgi:hypothetical protein
MIFVHTRFAQMLLAPFAVTAGGEMNRGLILAAIALHAASFFLTIRLQNHFSLTKHPICKQA